MILFLSITIFCILLLKVIEMAIHCHYIIAYGRKISISELVNKMPFTHVLVKAKLNGLFRLHYIITFSAILIFTGLINSWFIIFMELAVLSAIWVQLLQSLLSRITYGYADIFFRRISVAGYDETFSTFKDKQELISDFFKFFCGFIYISTIGYASVYSALYQIDNKSFNSSLGSYIDSLYFSVVTFATVGYGDISPSSEVARILTISEIFVGMGALVLLVFAYSITAQNDKHESPNTNNLEDAPDQKPSGNLPVR